MSSHSSQDLSSSEKMSSNSSQDLSSPHSSQDLSCPTDCLLHSPINSVNCSDSSNAADSSHVDTNSPPAITSDIDMTNGPAVLSMEALSLRAVVLYPHLHKFLEVADEDASIPISNEDELLEVLECFHPGLRLDARTLDETLLELFKLLVRPFFEHIESFDEETNTMLYWGVSL